MQNQVISEKRVKFGLLFCKETLYRFVDFFVKFLTRKQKKDLQLIWPLKYDTVSRN